MMSDPPISGLIFAMIFLFVIAVIPLGTISIEADAVLGIGDQFEGVTLTAFTYHGAGSYINPRVYSITLSENGHDFSFSFENTPFHLSIREMDFTVANHSRTDRVIWVSEGHQEIKTVSFLGLVVEMMERVNNG